MAKKKIRLAPETDARTVLAAVRGAVERNGYYWKPVDSTSGEAHEGKRQVRSKLFTFRLAMGVEVDGSTLVLKTLSSGMGFVGSADTPAGMAMIAGKFRRLTKAVTAELISTGLAR